MTKLSQALERTLRDGPMSAGQLWRSPRIAAMKLSESGVRNAVDRLVKQGKLKLSRAIKQPGDARTAQHSYSLANGQARKAAVVAKVTAPVKTDTIEIHHNGTVIIIERDPVSGEQSIRVR